MNSTPSNLAAIMRFTALPPPPPTPITLILAPWRSSSEKSTRKPPLSVVSSMCAPWGGFQRGRESGLGVSTFFPLAPEPRDLNPTLVVLPPQKIPEFPAQVLVVRGPQQSNVVSIDDQAHHGSVSRV